MENSEERELARQALIKGEITDDVNRKLLELSALFEISQLLNSSLNLTSIVDNILLSPMGRLMIGKGVFLLHRGHLVYEILTSKGLPRDLIGKTMSITDLPERPFLLKDVVGKGLSWVDFFEQFDGRLFIPIVLRNDILGLVVYGKKLVGADYQQSEIEFLSSIANIASTSIQNGLVYDELRAVNSRLDKKVQELHTLFDIGKELNATLDAVKIIRLLGYGLMGEMMVNRYVVLLKRQDTIDVAERRGFGEQDLGSEVLAEMFRVVQPASVESLEPGLMADKLTAMEAAAIIPMRSQDYTKGVLVLGSKITKKEYSPDELNFAFTLGNQAMISLENAWLFEDSLERKRLEEELQLARSIQENLLPASFPAWERCEVYGINVPSNQVGGDYFDVIRVNDEKAIVSIADVSGKGVPASLLMSNLQASLLALSTENKEFHRVVERINDIIYSNTGSDKFITFFGGILDTGTLEFTYVNAGHNPPYWVKGASGDLQTLDKGGVLLGFMPGMEYERETIRLEKGDMVVMFTDGVTEAVNERGELYEEPRLEQLLREHRACDARTLTELIAKSVRTYAGSAQQSDDITIVVIRAL